MKELHVYERTAIMADGRKVHYIGTISPAVLAELAARGVKIR